MREIRWLTKEASTDFGPLSFRIARPRLPTNRPHKLSRHPRLQMALRIHRAAMWRPGIRVSRGHCNRSGILMTKACRMDHVHQACLPQTTRQIGGVSNLRPKGSSLRVGQARRAASKMGQPSPRTTSFTRQLLKWSQVPAEARRAHGHLGSRMPSMPTASLPGPPRPQDPHPVKAWAPGLISTWLHQEVLHQSLWTTRAAPSIWTT